jgi:hypothetical protein
MFYFEGICLRIGICFLYLFSSFVSRPTPKAVHSVAKGNFYSQFYELRRLITSRELWKNNKLYAPAVWFKWINGWKGKEEVWILI